MYMNPLLPRKLHMRTRDWELFFWREVGEKRREEDDKG
jgi:hypothetical protein